MFFDVFIDRFVKWLTLATTKFDTPDQHLAEL